MGFFLVGGAGPWTARLFAFNDRPFAGPLIDHADARPQGQ